jgi:hypothetical protein
MKPFPFPTVSPQLPAPPIQYNSLSAEIRTLGFADGFFQRSRPLGESERLCLEQARQLCGPEPFTLHLACFNRARRSSHATQMLAELKALKLEAQLQYLARKTAGASTAQPGV